MDRLTWDQLLVSSPWASIAAGTERNLDAFVWKNVPEQAKVRIIRGYRCDTENELFHEWAAALQFPYYFGNSWAAFEDCVADLEWLRIDRVVVFIACADALLKKRRSEVALLIDILKRAVEEPVTMWEEDRPTRAPFLHFVFHVENAQQVQEPWAAIGPVLTMRRV